MDIKKAKAKVWEDRPGFPRQYGPDRTDHQPGSPLFPHEAYRDLVSILLLMGILFFLTAWGPPVLGPAKDLNLSEIIIPDWYVLFSFGLLKVSGTIVQALGLIRVGTPFGTVIFDAALWGNLLSGVPVIALLLLPFLDRGTEARPAKAPIRSAVGVAGIVFIFVSSLYSLREIITPELWPWLHDDVLKALFIVPPVLSGVGTYIGLRRLAFKPMYWWLVVPLAFSAIVVTVQAAFIAVAFASGPHGWALQAYMVLLAAPLLVYGFTVTFRPEREAHRINTIATALAVLGIVGMTVSLYYANRGALDYAVQSAIVPNMNTIVALPMFAMLVAYTGLRRPYSTYEYLLNECYQCGKCHAVCPVTTVEDDALGGLNLVYNSFKKQHDGVPLWTCLACDACSAVCPLDIKYSDYVLEERARVMARPDADGGGR